MPWTLVVVEKEHDCPLEVRVHQARRGDEELPGAQFDPAYSPWPERQTRWGRTPR